MVLLDSLKDFQTRSIRETQPLLHEYIPRYTPFRFKKLSNVIELTKESNYWEGPLNVGLCHMIFAFLCAILMFLALICFPVCGLPGHNWVCAYKFVISGAGFLAFVFSFFEFYSHVGIFHLWGPLTLKRTLDMERLAICNYIKNISDPFSDKITTAIAKCAPALELVKENLPKDPDFGQYKNALSVYTTHVTKLSTITFDVENNVKNISEFLTPLCKSNPYRVVVPIGDWNYTYLITKMTWEYAPTGFALSIWTLVLTFHIMRILFKRNTLCLHVLCTLGSLTVLAWWGACGYIIPYIIAIADFNSRKIDGILPIIRQLDPKMTRNKLQVFLNCSANSKSQWPFLKDFVAVSRPIMTIYEQSELALERGFGQFPPGSKKPEYSEFLIKLQNLTQNLYSTSRGLTLLSADDCTFYNTEFERVFSWLIREVYWALYVAYVSGVILCLLLTIAVCMMLRIRCNFYLVCYQKSRRVEEPDTIKCLPECPRRMEDDEPLPPIRQRCPPSCTGVMKQEVKNLVNKVMNLPSKIKQNGKPPEALQDQEPVYCTRPERIPPQPQATQVPKQKQEVYCVSDGKIPLTGQPLQGSKQRKLYCTTSRKGPHLETLHEAQPNQGQQYPGQQKQGQQNQIQPDGTQGTQGSIQRKLICKTKGKGPQIQTLHEAQPNQGQQYQGQQYQGQQYQGQQNQGQPDGTQGTQGRQSKGDAKVSIYLPFGKKMLKKYKDMKQQEKQNQDKGKAGNARDTSCDAPCAETQKSPEQRNRTSGTGRRRRGSRNSKLHEQGTFV